MSSDDERAAPTWDPTCWCGSCQSAHDEAKTAVDGIPRFGIMYLCRECGNKRCPRSWSHDAVCAARNPSSTGPVFAALPVPADLVGPAQLDKDWEEA